MNANNISSGNTPTATTSTAATTRPRPSVTNTMCSAASSTSTATGPTAHSSSSPQPTTPRLPACASTYPTNPCPTVNAPTSCTKPSPNSPPVTTARPFTRFYAIIIDGDNTYANGNCTFNTAQLAAIEEIQQDVDTQIPINAYGSTCSTTRASSVNYAAKTSSTRYGASIWALNPRTASAHPPRTHRRNRHSNYYTWLTRHGDTIADTA